MLGIDRAGNQSLLGDPGVKFFYGKLGEQKKRKEKMA
jgi:hypothetical protein